MRSTPFIQLTFPLLSLGKSCVARRIRAEPAAYRVLELLPPSWFPLHTGSIEFINKHGGGTYGSLSVLRVRRSNVKSDVLGTKSCSLLRIMTQHRVVFLVQLHQHPGLSELQAHARSQHIHTLERF